MPDKNGRFGSYGGSMYLKLYLPLKELGDAYEEAKNDPSFREELEELLKEFAWSADWKYITQKRLFEKIGGAKIFLKEEDLLHTGVIKLTMHWDRYCSPKGWVKENYC